MNTKHYVVDREKPDFRILDQAAAVLRQGGLVAFPTETVYGLGANGLDPGAVARIFAAKGRPADNPLILHIADVHEVNKLAARVPANAAALMAEYWPGPLTLVLARTRLVPDAVTGGLDTVAIRLPDSTVARELIRLAGVPVAAPSANTSGRPSPTTAGDVLADLAGRIELVIDAGPCGIGVESTVVDCTTPVPTLLRPGGVTLEMLIATLGEVEVDPALGGENIVPRAPGMKYTHYAPAAPMTLYEGEGGAAAAAVAGEAARLEAAGRRVGAVVSAETALLLPPTVVAAVYGIRGDLDAAAANLYTALRLFDAEPVDVILAESVSEAGLGLAVMNRLRKAAGYRIVHC
ncbi:L-threonylcarbamoyladenylate synthase [Anaeroselena agilis]|uniref:Threonylcarbamoyl-AMP synthase n=1 Tax=Anaeroselena agilis TaxID=3063788 RepID=A0ABU3P3W6_9FIRM|nr:L-threonylcarbamoyladenylate synthase [Selenomonadales bacterium 4137-cl]